MILYRPTDGEVYSASVQFQPRTCFLMTRLGQPIPKDIQKARNRIVKTMRKHRIKVIDANSVVTGKDFLLKIWHLIVSVPLGIAIIHEDMAQGTLSNIFYEIGMMQSYGKETLLIKTPLSNVPSDFVRTEHLEINTELERKLELYLKTFFELEEHYEVVADQLENNPLLSIDYLRRAYLISGKKTLRKKAKQVFESAGLDERARNSVETLLVDF